MQFKDIPQKVRRKTKLQISWAASGFQKQKFSEIFLAYRSKKHNEVSQN